MGSRSECKMCKYYWRTKVLYKVLWHAREEQRLHLRNLLMLTLWPLPAPSHLLPSRIFSLVFYSKPNTYNYQLPAYNNWSDDHFEWSLCSILQNSEIDRMKIGQFFNIFSDTQNKELQVMIILGIPPNGGINCTLIVARMLIFV